MEYCWSIREQLPRERLRRLGPALLSDGELITAVLGSGSARGSAREIAERLLSRFQGSLRQLFSSHPAHLEQVPGMGRAKCSALLAGMELGRRMALRDEDGGLRVGSARQAWNIIREQIPSDNNETIIALYLDNRNHLLSLEDVGGRRQPAGSELDLRKLLRSLLNLNASGLILAHNHPSGETRPSPEDVEMSVRLAELLAGMGSELVDHLIVSPAGFTRIDWTRS